jgi:hypothetical protein
VRRSGATSANTVRVEHRTRKPARLWSVWAILGALGATSMALAQTTRGGSAQHAGRRPADPADERTTDAPAPTASGAAAAPPGDAGPAPPPSNESLDAGKLSPLNPAPNEFSDAEAAPPLDYDRLLTDIAALRARVSAVSDTLFHSRIVITIESSGDHGRLASLGVSLDDGVIWTMPPSFRIEDQATVYDHAVAPGHHAVTVDAERRDDRNDTYRSAQRSRFIVDVPADQRLVVNLRLGDDSNMGSDFPSNHEGRYELRVRAQAKAQPLGR